MCPPLVFEHEPAYPPDHAHLPGETSSRRVSDDGGHTEPPLQAFEDCAAPSDINRRIRQENPSRETGVLLKMFLFAFTASKISVIVPPAQRVTGLVLHPVAPNIEVTKALIEVSNGNRRSLDQLMPAVYDELRRLAESFMRSERAGHTLQPTALVHEAYLRLIDQKEVDWHNRAHFFSIAAETMRRILVNYAHGHKAAKRGGEATRMSIDEVAGIAGASEVDLVLLDDALKQLAAMDSDQARIVELRFFGGLTVKEVAVVMGISTATVEREWRTAKAWLQDQIT